MNTHLEQLFETPKSFLQDAWHNAGFEKATAVQSRAVPLISEGKDVIAEAPTGSGKTLAYLLPLMQHINPEHKHVQAVILASSHELVMQIHKELQAWAEGSGITGITLIGGANVKRQLEKLKKRPQIIIGTPGRVMELINKKKLKMHEVKTLVFDEADQLFNPEHQQTIQAVVKSTMSDRQIVLFSATLSEQVADSAQKLMNKPEIIRVTKDEVETPPVEHVYLVTEARQKLDTLRKLIRGSEMKALAFVRDIGNLSVSAEKLEYKGIEAGVIHGESKKQEREKTIKEFRSGNKPIVLATDVAARGLDIKDITHIINLDLPENTDQYIHRAGRIGRLGTAGGTVISIITEQEEKQLQKIATNMNVKLCRKQLVKGKLINPK
ncbi:DEAD/DEAH box helicase [Sediminibacillus massiliensis]|uniref:DEAD/DEAH box helicase n=1 Tax=Sediminibacillus massiliensis TaxID=1926277 RepID=UPI000988773D|nr:DEAD/DEAH box helicase [Sediminibacillus massiliensis]